MELKDKTKVIESMKKLSCLQIEKPKIESTKCLENPKLSSLYSKISYSVASLLLSDVFPIYRAFSRVF
jgi:hypothetical protein